MISQEQAESILEIKIVELCILKELKEEAWIAIYSGKQLIMPSGKRMWTKKQYARSALKNAIYIEPKEVFNNALEELENSGKIQYRKISI